MSYKQGQKLVCVETDIPIECPQPNEGDTVTLSKEKGKQIMLVEYDDPIYEYWYDAKKFIPLKDWNQMDEEIKEALDPAYLFTPHFAKGNLDD